MASLGHNVLTHRYLGKVILIMKTIFFSWYIFMIDITSFPQKRDSGAFRDLTHFGQVTLICVSKLTNIGSDNGLLPCWHQAIFWTNAGILLNGSLGTNFTEILLEFMHFHSIKCIWKKSSGNGGNFVSAQTMAFYCQITHRIMYHQASNRLKFFNYSAS